MFSSRFQLLDGLHVERSETVVENACPVGCTSLFFTDRVSQTSAPAPTRRSTFNEVAREQDVAQHVLSQSLSMERIIINLFGGGCGVISASADYSIDPTVSRNFCSLCCIGLFFADVSGGESHKHGLLWHPTGTEKTLDQERTDLYNLFTGDFFSMAGWLPVILTDGAHKPWHQATRQSGC